MPDARRTGYGCSCDDAETDGDPGANIAVRALLRSLPPLPHAWRTYIICIRLCRRLVYVFTVLLQRQEPEGMRRPTVKIETESAQRELAALYTSLSPTHRVRRGPIRLCRQHVRPGVCSFLDTRTRKRFDRACTLVRRPMGVTYLRPVMIVIVGPFVVPASGIGSKVTVLQNGLRSWKKGGRQREMRRESRPAMSTKPRCLDCRL